LLALLKGHGIQAVADVRRFPASRRHPHFAGEPLAALLEADGIGYRWHPELGGRRAPRPDSRNTGWRVAAFRGYADYMETAEFGLAFGQLMDAARRHRTAIMCAESLWWQCHRRLIADRLVAEGHEVVHIMSESKAEAHRLIAPAKLVAGRLDYGAEQAPLPLDD
jgi:uncharacterized protein (DUF488 family)